MDQRDKIPAFCEHNMYSLDVNEDNIHSLVQTRIKQHRQQMNILYNSLLSSTTLKDKGGCLRSK